MDKFELHLPVKSEQQNAISLLKDNCDLSIAELKTAINKGALWLTTGKTTKRFRRVKKALKPTDTLHFYYDKNILQQTTDDAILLADYHDFSLWLKPFGMLSQGSKWSEHTTITRFVSQYFENQRSVFLVHRLDRATTGIMVVTHSKAATRLFGKLFEKHDLIKTYHAICHHNNLELKKEIVIDNPIDDKTATSKVALLAYDKESDYALVEVTIETGRKHQIRKHLASIGMPIVGDRLHGIATNNTEQDLQLCAVRLAFTSPIDEQLVDINLPDNLKPTLI